jgi:DNA polymerase-4
VSGERRRRSISQESTFGEDLHELAAIEAVIRRQADQCARRLADRALYARAVQLKLRSGGFSTLTRSRTLAGFTRAADAIADTAVDMAREWARYQSRIGVRLIGVGVSGLEASPDPGQLLQPRSGA